MAVPIIIADDPDVIALDLAWSTTVVPELLGLAVVAGVCALLYRTAVRVSA